MLLVALAPLLLFARAATALPASVLASGSASMHGSLRGVGSTAALTAGALQCPTGVAVHGSGTGHGATAVHCDTGTRAPAPRVTMTVESLRRRLVYFTIDSP